MNNIKEFAEKTIERLEEKIKVTSLEIIVKGTKDKPYFEIKYKELAKDDYNIGYSSYDLNNVFRWKEECFEIVKQPAEEYKSKLIADIKFAIEASNTNDNYMAGLRNGLRYCLALIDGKEPEFEHCNQDSTKNNQGGIPCSERLPAQQEESDDYRYRKKPIEIEAFQYDGDLKGNSGYYVPEWAVKAFEEGIMYYDSLEQEEPPCELFIKTLEGNYHVSVNDYVIQGVNGELYPCKPDIFEKTYEKVTEPQKEIPTKHYEERFNRVM